MVKLKVDQDVKVVCTERCWMVEGRFTLPKRVDKIRVENKGWKVTGEQNAMGGSEGRSRE